MRNRSMSSMICCARSYLLAPCFTRVPSSRDTHRWSKTASIATMPSSSRESGARSSLVKTPAVRAASNALGDSGSQPPNTMSSRPESETSSRILCSTPVASSIVPICVSEPMGEANPCRAASTPAYNVVDTAPMPGVRMPRRPTAGAIVGEVMPLG